MMGSVQGSPQHRLNSSAGTQLLSSRVSHCRRVDCGAGMTRASYIRVLGNRVPPLVPIQPSVIADHGGGSDGSCNWVSATHMGGSRRVLSSGLWPCASTTGM